MTLRRSSGRPHSYGIEELKIPSTVPCEFLSTCCGPQARQKAFQSAKPPDPRRIMVMSRPLLPSNEELQAFLSKYHMLMFPFERSPFSSSTEIGRSNSFRTEKLLPAFPPVPPLLSIARIFCPRELSIVDHLHRKDLYLFDLGTKSVRGSLEVVATLKVCSLDFEIFQSIGNQFSNPRAESSPLASPAQTPATAVPAPRRLSMRKIVKDPSNSSGLDGSNR